MSEKIEQNTEISSFDVSEDVKELVREVILKHNFDSGLQVKYSSGSDVGDNYTSRTIAVDITDNKESISLFIKYAHDVKSDGMPLEKYYTNEIYFYDVIYKILSKFSEERGVKDAFTNVPKCHGTSEKYVVVLSNAKNAGYHLFDRLKAMNESHIAITLKALAKYHALCFAFKDQEREQFEEIANKETFNFLYESARDEFGPMKNLFETTIEAFLSQLDPVQDKHIMERCQNLWEEYRRVLIDSQSSDNQNLIITKGDCWSNNVMFRYGDYDKENPTDVILVDWQVLGLGPVIFDVSYFLYIAVYNEELEKFEHYLKIYHDQLSESIRLLGSNPDTLYPYPVFKEEWKRYSRFGYMLTLVVSKLLLVDKEEAPDITRKEDANELFGKFGELKINAEYMRRMRKLTEHFIENDFW